MKTSVPKLSFFIPLFFVVLSLFSYLCPAQTPVLYGMTYYGGTSSGTIITFDPASDKEKVIWDFGSGTDGARPNGNLTYDPVNGLFYGMTYAGGSMGYGTIFSFNPVTDKDSVVWSFKGFYDANSPLGSLLYNATNGLFYGMTYYGGDSAKGAIITFNPTTNAENIVWSFNGGSDGANPRGDLVPDAGNGLLYGMTSSGGSSNSGIIFSFDPTTTAEKVLWDFASVTNDGANPYGKFVLDSINGLFYATTQQGGSFSYGTIISFNPSNNEENVVWSLGLSADGKNPNGNLVYHSANGLFYGITSYGGINAVGSIFTFNPSTNAEKVVWSFKNNSADANDPTGDLLFDASNGLFYGMAQYGGTAYGYGAIFSFNPATNRDSVVWSFQVGDGNNPYGSFVLYPPSVSTAINTVYNFTDDMNIYPNPSIGSFTFTTSSELNNSLLEIYNVWGTKVYSKSFNTQEALRTTQDVSFLPTGIYFVRVSDGQQQFNRKLIISR